MSVSSRVVYLYILKIFVVKSSLIALLFASVQYRNYQLREVKPYLLTSSTVCRILILTCTTLRSHHCSNHEIILVKFVKDMFRVQ